MQKELELWHILINLGKCGMFQKTSKQSNWIFFLFGEGSSSGD
jgi:hypothetical protein